jgi:hypothetical protein
MSKKIGGLVSNYKLLNFDVFAEEFLRENNPRVITIIGASKIDEQLLEILRTYFMPKIESGNKTDELLIGDTPLGTFSSRIKIIYRLGLIDIS